jgi:predicted ribonuclease YlaK
MRNAVKTKRKSARLNRDIDPSEKTLEVVSHVMAVLSEREVSFKKEDFIKECVSCKIFSPSYAEILSAIESKITSGDLIEVGDDRQELFTTKAGQDLEKATIDQLYQGFEKLEPVCSNIDLKKLFPDIDFSEGQGDSLKLILETRDQFIGVQGYAGTGKTFMLKSATTIADEILKTYRRLLQRTKNE